MISFRAKKAINGDPTQNMVTASVGSYATNLVIGPAHDVYRLEVDSDEAGIATKAITVGFVAESVTEGGVNQYRFYDLDISAKYPDVERWFEDNNLAANGGVPPDFESRFYEPALSAWTNSLATMDVYYLRYATYRDWLKTNAVLKARMAEVFNEYGIKVALDDTRATWAHALNNYETPSYQASINVLQDLTDYGWSLCAVGLQSVLSKPWSGGDYAMSWRILDIVEYIMQVKPHFPDLEYGVIDALPVKGLEYKSHYTDLKNAVEAEGYTLDFIHQDFPVDYALENKNGVTFQTMVEVERFVRNEIGCRPGLFLTSSDGGKASDEAFRSDVVEGLDAYLAAGGGARHACLSAWFPYPVYSTPDEVDSSVNTNGATMLGTFLLADGIIDDYESVQGLPLSDGFETGFGNWVSADTNQVFIVNRTASEGSHSVLISDDKAGSMLTLAQPIDASAYATLSIGFDFMPLSMEGADEAYLEYYNGLEWEIVGAFGPSLRHVNKQWYATNIAVDAASYPMPQDACFRFRQAGTGIADFIYYDAITVEGN